MNDKERQAFEKSVHEAARVMAAAFKRMAKANEEAGRQAAVAVAKLMAAVAADRETE